MMRLQKWISEGKATSPAASRIKYVGGAWGIGLHLNALTASSSGKAVKIETLASGKQEISQPPSPAAHMTSGSDPVSKSLALTTVETDFVPFDNKDKVMEMLLRH
ncbi:protein tesmin/TSO1 CXC [Salix suchowensis]|nr:protein tesmin/TSO1 CXC [Salix suchowensis]